MKENCDRCGKPVLPETLTNIQGKNFKVCRDCVDSYYKGCSCCQKQVEHDELVTILSGEKFDTVCRECLQKHFVPCSECGEFIEAGSAYTHKNKKYCRYCKEII